MKMPMKMLSDPIAVHARELIAHLGEDPCRAGLADTPERYAQAMRFLTGGYEAEAEGDPAAGIAPGTRWEDLPDD